MIDCFYWTGSGQELDQGQRVDQRASDHVAEPQILPDAPGRLSVAGPAAARRGHRRGARPGAGQPAQQKLYPFGHQRQSARFLLLSLLPKMQRQNRLECWKKKGAAYEMKEKIEKKIRLSYVSTQF